MDALKFYGFLLVAAIVSAPFVLAFNVVDARVGLTEDGRRYKIEREVNEEISRDSLKAVIKLRRDSIEAERLLQSLKKQQASR